MPNFGALALRGFLKRDDLLYRLVLGSFWGEGEGEYEEGGGEIGVMSGVIFQMPVMFHLKRSY
jgi:hypothetical protein